jgi:hypothetical protein
MDSALVRIFVIVTNTKRNNLKGGRIYFGSCFQKFQPMVSWLCCFRPVARQKHHGGGCLSHGSQEAKREPGDKIHLSRAHPVAHFLQLGLTSYSPTPLHDVIILLVQSGINPPVKAEPSWSNHFPKAPHLNTACNWAQAFDT